MPEVKTKLTGRRRLSRHHEKNQVRDDCRTIAGIMQKATKAPPRMWGSSIVGFGTLRYKYANGKDAEFMVTAFSPRKQNITLYLGHLDEQRDLLEKLGAHSCGKGASTSSGCPMCVCPRPSSSDVGRIRKAHRHERHQVIRPDIPRPAGPYSPGMGFERLVFVAGQGGTISDRRMPAT
jgi:hypothetical protein